MKSGIESSHPLYSFTTLSAVAVTVGIVVGVGIFRLPPIVAENSDSGFQFMFFWVTGGAIALMGALCYAELASSRPDAGGEYIYLRRAFGPAIGFLFSWGRMTVIQTGSIALIAFILGDYASNIIHLGRYSTSIYAVSMIVLLTGLNLLGTKHSRRVQNIFTISLVLILVLISITGLFSISPEFQSISGSVDRSSRLFSGGSPGLAMIFVMLTYGGWNEASYLTGELHNVKTNIIRVLVLSICLITGLYLLVNYSYLHLLGLEALQTTETVGSDLTELVFGAGGSLMVTFIVIAASLSTANATIITGARTNYALGRDFQLLGFLGRWNRRRNTPAHALIVQGLVALLLVGLGTWSQGTVITMVDYTAPVFWLFMLMITTSLFIFRFSSNSVAGSFKVPAYPFIPLLFLAACLYMLYSSLAFTGIGAIAGVGILIAGIPVYYFSRSNSKQF